jgi:hypothetical protein
MFFRYVFTEILLSQQKRNHLRPHVTEIPLTPPFQKAPSSRLISESTSFRDIISSFRKPISTCLDK